MRNQCTLHKPPLSFWHDKMARTLTLSKKLLEWQNGRHTLGLLWISLGLGLCCWVEGSQRVLSFRREHGRRSQMLGEQLLHKKEADKYKIIVTELDDEKGSMDLIVGVFFITSLCKWVHYTWVHMYLTYLISWCVLLHLPTLTLSLSPGSLPINNTFIVKTTPFSQFFLKD